MNAQRQARLEGRARIIKALAYPARLLIVEELAQGERCVAELTQMIGSDISTVSKHLSLLRAVGILGSDKRGAQVYYRLRVPCVLNFFGCVEAVIRASAQDQLRMIEE